MMDFITAGSLAIAAGAPVAGLLVLRHPPALSVPRTPIAVAFGAVVLLMGIATGVHLLAGSGTEMAAISYITAIVLGGLLALLLTAFMIARAFPADRTPPSRRKVVLAIGAHPDDIEFGCGAALMRYRADGYETHGIVLTSGEYGNRFARSKTNGRREEAERAGRIMKLDTLTVLNFPDCKLISRRAEVKRALEEAMTRLTPDLVFTHNRIDLHSDHRLVFNATIEACRNVPTVLCYENPNTPPEFRPSFFVDASTHIDAKISALKCHASQMRKPYFKADLIRSMARVRGQQARLRFAEGFEVVRCRLGAV